MSNEAASGSVDTAAAPPALGSAAAATTTASEGKDGGGGGGGGDDELLRDFHAALADEVTAVPIAACCALHGVVMRTRAATVLELQKELTAAAARLKNAVPDITVVTGSDVYLRLVSKIVMTSDAPDFEPCLRALREHGRHFKRAGELSRDRIAALGDRFIQEDSVVLVHGYSRSVMTLLLNASKRSKHFDVYVLEGRPGEHGFRVCQELSAAGVPVTVTPDAAVGYIMEKVDMVLVGAHGVVESGGIINKLGTSTVAIVAAAMNKPLYVAVESHKFVRIFPINQVDMQAMTSVAPPAEGDAAASEGLFPNKYLSSLPEGSKLEVPQWDYTSPDYITLLVTDIGVFTPSAVSDELIKMYQ